MSNDNDKITNANEINNFFKIPIHYNAQKVELKKNIIDDLELVTTIDQSCNSIYSYFFNNDNDISKKLNEQISKYYTTDTIFLKDNQKLLKEYKKLDNKYTDFSPNYKNIIEIWNEVKIESGFKEKYCYVDWKMFDFLNNSVLFLQFMSIYNLFSPIFTLLTPIIILIIPFLVIKIKGLDLNLSEYVDILKIVAKQNALGKLLICDFNEIQMHERIYIMLSAGLYLFSIYQNIMVCIRFHKNMTTIHNHFKEIKIYLNYTLDRMENYFAYSIDLTSQQEFNNNLKLKIDALRNIQSKLASVSEYSLYNISKIKEIGNVLKYFYELHTDTNYEDAIMYSLGFNAYIDCIEGLQNNIANKTINFAIFIKENKKNIFKNSYYAPLSKTKNELKPIKNTIKFKKNIIITGPNASGKTTILKSTLINIIFTQQFGCGFYDTAKLAPYNHIHCYLNIPDTSGRDSLFQAEARRCKEILDIIKDYKYQTHFCVFDELYSGTNPEEAEISSIAFMNYLTKNKNVHCFLTTHFINVCKKLVHNTNIVNCNMVTKKQHGRLTYHYKLKKGISDVKGGITVLTEMNYPKEIIESAIYG